MNAEAFQVFIAANVADKFTAHENCAGTESWLLPLIADGAPRILVEAELEKS